MYCSSLWKNRTYLCVTANYPVSCKPVQGRERKFVEIRVYLSPWYRVLTKAMFIPKVATGMESPKMHSSTRCKNRTYLCGTTNYPVSCKPVYYQEQKVAEIRVSLLLPFTMVPCLHKSNVYIKRKLQVWRVQKRVPLVGAKTALICAGLHTTPSHVSQCRATNGNLRKSGTTFRLDTVFLPNQYLCQKEATGMESPKMHSSSRCKNHTYLCGTANYPVPCKLV